MNIILFGPPGVGKSTLIAILKSRDFRAIDLEDFYPNRIRFQVPNLVDDAFIGAADLNPRRKYPHATKIILLPDQDVYDRRRKQRDQLIPSKSAQMHHDISMWEGIPDAIYIRDNVTAQVLANRLAKMMLKD